MLLCGQQTNFSTITHLKIDDYMAVFSFPFQSKKMIIGKESDFQLFFYLFCYHTRGFDII